MADKTTDTTQDELAAIESELTELLTVKPPADMRDLTLDAVRKELKPSRNPMIIRLMSVAASITVACIIIYQIQKPGIPTPPTEPKVNIERINQLVEQALKPSSPNLPTVANYRGKTMAELDALLDEHERRMLARTKNKDSLQAPVIRPQTDEKKK